MVSFVLHFLWFINTTMENFKQEKNNTPEHIWKEQKSISNNEFTQSIQPKEDTKTFRWSNSFIVSGPASVFRVEPALREVPVIHFLIC